MSKSKKAVKAAHGEMTGKPTYRALEQKVNAAIQEDPRWDTDKHGQPEGSPGDREPFVVDILVPDDDGHQCAVISTDDGRLVKHGFTWDGDTVVMDDGESEETECTPVYSKAVEERDEVVKAAWSDEARAAALEARRKSSEANDKSDKAATISAQAGRSGKNEDHVAAEKSHGEAIDAHREAQMAHSKAAVAYSGKDKQFKEHFDLATHHQAAIKAHQEAFLRHGLAQQGVNSKDADPSAAVTAKDAVHCHDAGSQIAQDSKWEQDQPVEFQWMPGGVTTITANYAGKPIRLTVECDEATAATVQASLDEWRERYPKQKPFGCVEHREEEASIYPRSFSWHDEPEPGVFCSGDPTALGARNVNGRIHRAWSPSFTTDAEYAKAKDKGGVMVFPTGARGSESNPAAITGVAFSVGSLTNKPAFKNILPVRAKQAEPQPETNKDAEPQKETRMKVKFIRARGNYTAGSAHELEGNDLKEATASGDAIEYNAALTIEAKDAENKTLRESIKAQQKQIVKDKVEAAKKRFAVDPKDEAVLARACERLDKGADIELVCELIDSLQPKHDLSKLGGRITTPVKAGEAHVWAGEMTPQEAGDGYIKIRASMDSLVRQPTKDNMIKAIELSKESCALLKTKIMPIFAKGEDYMLKDLVTAADTSDPNTQVGTLATGLLLMRNLGFLKNKLGWMPYITTDLRSEPAMFGQNILTRYITPPGVLTYVPGVGYTSDATTISNAALSATTGEGATQTSGTRTPSVPSSTDRNVIINKHKGVEIVFPTNTLGSTMRNLFAEQQSAQFYSLAEQVNKDFLTSVFTSTWSGNVASYALGGNNFGLTGLVALKLRCTINQMPDVGRMVLLNSVYHDQILADSNLVTAKAITALVNKDQSAFESGELPMIYGIKVLESQLAAYNGGLVTITDPTAVAATVGTGYVGFAGNTAAMLFVARVPQDYTKVLVDIPSTASLEIVTEPDSGLSILFTKYVDHGLAQVSARCALMYGFSQGHPKQGFLLTA